MSAEGLSENLVADALIDCKGDLVRTASKLGVKIGRLNQWLRHTPALRSLALEVEKVKKDEAYDAMSRDQFSDEITSRMQAYQLEGLEAIHSLATMDHGGVASLAEVKLKAAIQLRGTQVSDSGGLVSVLQELGEQYIASAHRVKGLRATATISLTMESPAEAEALVIQAQ